MADINSKPALKSTSVTQFEAELDAQSHLAAVGKSRPAQLASDDPTNSSANLVELVELLFFAYRDFTGDADDLLADLKYGRAHHRVIHFVARHPGLRVADLLDILRITKQSLARVLKQLIEEGFVAQKSGKTDRRERRLFLTQKGLDFADKLTTLQCARIANALKTVGLAGKDHIEAFLVAMISESDQAAVAALFEKAVDNELKHKRGTGLDDNNDG